MISNTHLPNDLCFREIEPSQLFLTTTCKAVIDKHGFRECNPGFLGEHGKPARYEPWTLQIMPLLAASPELSLCHKKLGFSVAMIFSLGPRSVVPLHADPNRGASINMLIDGWHSHTMFVNDVYFNELKYKPHKLYVYNSTIPHQVVNFDNYRYLLSLSFKNMRPYEEVVEFLNSRDLLVSNNN